MMEKNILNVLAVGLGSEKCSDPTYWWGNGVGFGDLESVIHH